MRKWTHISEERDSLAAMSPAFTCAQPKSLTSPLIFASPHSGACYPPSFLSRSECSLTDLRQNEDAYIDALLACVTDFGAPLLSANFPRCYVDANRAPDELPKDWDGSAKKLTARAKAGFGVIPLIIAQNKPIYKTPLPKSIAALRMKALYYPYHDALKSLIAQAQNHFGQALIIDCHSMPGFAPMGARRADIVLGDRYGLSCQPHVMDAIEHAFTSRGYSVTRNYPYAGGYVTQHYGVPSTGVEAVQIEINRDLYQNAVTLKAKPKPYQKLAADLADITEELIERLSPAADAIAAE